MTDRQETQHGIEVLLFAESDHSTSVAVRAVTEPQCGSHVAVRLFYRITIQHSSESEPVEAVVSMLDVVPLMTDRAASITTFRVKLTDVAFVRVEPMRSYGQIDFFR